MSAKRYNTFFIIDSLNFDAKIINLRRKPATLKQFIGKKLVEKEIAARNAFDTEIILDITLRGKLNENQTIAQEITTLQGFEDQVSHTYTDGVNNGTYIVVDIQEIPEIFDDAVKMKAKIITFNQ